MGVFQREIMFFEKKTKLNFCCVVVVAGVVAEQLYVVILLNEFPEHELVVFSIVVVHCKLRAYVGSADRY